MFGGGEPSPYSLVLKGSTTRTHTHTIYICCLTSVQRWAPAVSSLVDLSSDGSGVTRPVSETLAPAPPSPNHGKLPLETLAGNDAPFFPDHGKLPLETLAGNDAPIFPDAA